LIRRRTTKTPMTKTPTKRERPVTLFLKAERENQQLMSSRAVSTSTKETI
jgi:hypothetical protein